MSHPNNQENSERLKKESPVSTVSENATATDRVTNWKIKYGRLLYSLLILLILVVALTYVLRKLPYDSRNETIPGAVDITQLTPADDTSTELDRQLAQEKLAEFKAENNDERIVLTTDKYGEYLDRINPDVWSLARCEAGFRDDLEANQQVIYWNEEKDIVLELPYNDQWGNDTFSIPAFEAARVPGEQTAEHIAFGPIQSFFEGGCSWLRPYTLSFEEPVSPEAHTQRIKEQYGYSDYEYSDLQYEPTIEQAGDTTFVHYEVSAFCQTFHVVTFGEQYNYKLSTGCGTPEDLEVLKTIARTAQFASNMPQRAKKFGEVSINECGLTVTYNRDEYPAPAKRQFSSQESGEIDWFEISFGPRSPSQMIAYIECRKIIPEVNERIGTNFYDPAYYVGIQSDGESQVNPFDYPVLAPATQRAISKLYSARNKGYSEGSEAISFATDEWLYHFHFRTTPTPETAKNLMISVKEGR